MDVAEDVRPTRPGNGLRVVPAPAEAAELSDGFWYSVKRRVLGAPLVTEQLREERLSKPLALGVLSCDGLSSAVFGPTLAGQVMFFGLQAATAAILFTGGNTSSPVSRSWPASSPRTLFCPAG
jgi:hypothetical protein